MPTIRETIEAGKQARLKRQAALDPLFRDQKSVADIVLPQIVAKKFQELEDCYSQKFYLFQEAMNKEQEALVEEMKRAINSIKDPMPDSEIISVIMANIPKVKDGHTPTEAELLSLIKPLIKAPVNGKTPSDSRLLSLIRPLLPEEDKPAEIADKLNTLTGAIDMKVIKDLEKFLNQLSRASKNGSKPYLHGGGISEILAGTGITVTANGHGSFTIAATSSGINVETPTGTINSSNTAFTVAHTPTFIVSDGSTYFENNGYTRVGLAITMSNPPTQYIRSFYA